MNNRKIYRKRLLEKVEDKEERYKQFKDRPIEIKSVDGVVMVLTDDEKRKIMIEMDKRREERKWNG